MRISILAAALLLGCSGGDLTLPASGEPFALRIVSGDDQRAEAGALLGHPLTVQVVDVASEPVPGATVEFGFVGEIPGAGLDPAAVTTDQEGRASAFVRLGSHAGEHLVVARVAGSAAPDLAARFRATALSGGGGGDDDGDDDGGDDDDGTGGGGDDGGSGGGGGPELPVPPDPLPVEPGQYPPPGACRLWTPSLPPGQQDAPEACGDAVSQAPAGSWVLFRPVDRNEVHVRVIHPSRGGTIVRVWIYDASGRLLREESTGGS